MTRINIDDPDTWPSGLFTCHTDGCENRGLTLCLQVPEKPADHHVICGACGQDITDRKTAPAGTDLGLVE